MPERSVDRAKQFIPFAALRGYYDLVAEVARYREERRELAPDREDELDATLSEMEEGDEVEVRHFDKDAYVTTTGSMDEIRVEDGVLVVGGVRIEAKDIVGLEPVMLKEYELRSIEL